MGLEKARFRGNPRVKSGLLIVKTAQETENVLEAGQ